MAYDDDGDNDDDNDSGNDDGQHLDCSRSKADVEAEEDLAVRNVSVHGNPFGPVDGEGKSAQTAVPANDQR